MENAYTIDENIREGEVRKVDLYTNERVSRWKRRTVTAVTIVSKAIAYRPGQSAYMVEDADRNQATFHQIFLQKLASRAEYEACN